MAWSAIKLSSSKLSSSKHSKLCKEEPSEQLVVGLITSALLSTSSDPVPSVTKRRHEIMANPRGDLTEDDDLYDELLASANEKKRRLTVDQVKFLEMSFNMDLKLEPERKAMIAKRLGIRPRQVAIWFQNRRARWKNKQLEQDYEALKASYNDLIKENESIMKKNQAIDEENRRLQEEVAKLTSILKSRSVPCYVDGSGVKIVLDSESDSDSAMKAMEQLSSELELVSPSKSDAQTEMLDTEKLSHSTSGEAIVAFVDQTFGERNSLIACAAFKFEADYRIFSPSEDVFFNFSQSVNGFNIDDLLYEDCSYGFRWNG